MPVYDNDIAALNTEFGKSEIIYVAIAVLKYLNSEHIAIAVSLLSRLVFNSDTDRNFAQQYVNAGGLSVIKKYHLLDPENQVNLIIDTLSLISQLARLSKDFYDFIHKATLYSELRVLIQNSDAGIRAKVCNLIGNLCRHTGFFYDKLQKSGLIASAI